MAKTKSDWTLVLKTDNYFYWIDQSRGVYKCTKAHDCVPTGRGGYCSLAALMELKDENINGIDAIRSFENSLSKLKYVAEKTREQFYFHKGHVYYSEIETENVEDRGILNNLLEVDYMIRAYPILTKMLPESVLQFYQDWRAN